MPTQGEDAIPLEKSDLETVHAHCARTRERVALFIAAKLNVSLSLEWQVFAIADPRNSNCKRTIKRAYSFYAKSCCRIGLRLGYLRCVPTRGGNEHKLSIALEQDVFPACGAAVVVCLQYYHGAGDEQRTADDSETFQSRGHNVRRKEAAAKILPPQS